jgi:Holliday junction resolvasome RuvABC endonuclease subunit
MSSEPPPYGGGSSIYYMVIAGIDYSLRGPAICVYNGEEKDPFCFTKCKFYYLTDTKKYAKTFLTNIHGNIFDEYNHDCQRYDSISSWAVDVCHGCEQVAIEGYAYNAKGRVFHIAENTGILKYKFYQQSIPVEIISPSEVKKRATDNGNANKNEMHEFFKKETGYNLAGIMTPMKKDVTNPVSDVVDAYYVCKCLYERIMGI